MIRGVVNSRREAILRVVIHGPTGRSMECEVILDTGFTGMVTLPAGTVQALELRWQTRGEAVLANGDIETFDVYMASVEWNGKLQPIQIEAAETEPLIGMELLIGHEVRIEVVNGGSVSIVPIP